MLQFRFDEDFAGNWKAGQIVPCEVMGEDYLVDKAGLINKEELRKHGKFMGLQATCIEWDTDDEEVTLPSEVVIPDGVVPEYADVDEDINSYAEEVEDWLSTTYEYCVVGFVLEKMWL